MIVENLEEKKEEQSEEKIKNEDAGVIKSSDNISLNNQPVQPIQPANPIVENTTPRNNREEIINSQPTEPSENVVAPIIAPPTSTDVGKEDN